MAYSDKVLDHYNNPRNVGSLDKSIANVGTGMVGAPECGDVMKLQVKVNDETGIIEDAKFKTFGCGSAIASSSLATEWLKGKTVDQALEIKNTDIVERTEPAAGEDSLLGARRRRDQGRDRRLQAPSRPSLSRSGRGSVTMGDTVQIETSAPSAPQSRRNRSLSRRRPSRNSAGLRREEGLGWPASGRLGRRLFGPELSVQVRRAAPATDNVFDFDDVQVFVDPKSMVFLDGMTLDWKDSLMQSGFVFNNPHASKSCGCGTSFSS